MNSRVTQKPLSAIEEIACAVTQLAHRHGYAPENLISDLEDRVLGSPLRPSSGRPTQPSAYVNVPNLEDASSTELVIHVCRMGSYLTKGNEEIRILFDYHDNTAQTAVDRLFDSKPGTFTSIVIGNQTCTIDSNLKIDVYNALMTYLATHEQENR